MTITFFASFTIAFSLNLPFVPLGLPASSYISTRCLNQLMSSALVTPFTTITPPLLQLLLSHFGLWSPAVNTLVQTVFGLIEWGQTLTTLFHISMDILFVERSRRHLYVRIRALTFRDIINHMVCNVSAQEDISDSSSQVGIQALPTNGDEVTDDEACTVSDEYTDDTDSISVLLSPRPYPLPATACHKFRRSLRRIWNIRPKTTANVVASSLSVTATVSSASSMTSCMESATSTLTQTDSTSVLDEWEDDRSRLSASGHLKGICTVGGYQMRPSETLQTDRSACPPKRRTVAATARRWLNRCLRIVKGV